MRENRIWALLAYVLAPVGSLLALVLAPDDPVLQNHARQSLIAGLVVAGIVMLASVIPFMVCLTPLAFVAWAYLVYCGIRAYQGQPVEIPIIGRL